jgi:hypothetical protein
MASTFKSLQQILDQVDLYLPGQKTLAYSCYSIKDKRENNHNIDDGAE